MDIQSAQLVRYDFYRNILYQDVSNSLKEIFQDKTTFPEQTVDFGGRDLRVEATHFNNIQEKLLPDEFDSLHSYLVQDTGSQYFFHQITVATLTESELDRIIPGDVTANRSCRTDWYNEINKITNYFPASLIQDSAPQPLILCVNPEQDELTGFSTNSPEQLTEFLSTNAGELDNWGFDPLSEVSLINSSYLITNGETLSTPLPVLNINYRGNPLEADDNYWEQWFEFEYRKLKTIMDLFLVNHWISWRKEKIGDIDSQSYNYRMDEIESATSVQEVSETEEDLESLRKDWVETHSATADEYEEMKEIIELYQQEQDGTVFDRPVRGDTKTYLSENVCRTQKELNDLSNTLDRVGNKLEMFTTVVQDRIQSRATKSNLELQKSVRRLTILLAIIAIVEFFLEYIPAKFFESTSLTLTTNSLLFLLVFVAIIGFFHGYAQK